MRDHVLLTCRLVTVRAIEFHGDADATCAMRVVHRGDSAPGLAPTLSPYPQCKQHGEKRFALFRKEVFEAHRAFAIRCTCEDSPGLEDLEPSRQDLRRRTGLRLNRIEVRHTVKKLSHDQH